MRSSQSGPRSSPGHSPLPPLPHRRQSSTPRLQIIDGVLASSRTPDGQDDSGISWSSLLSEEVTATGTATRPRRDRATAKAGTTHTVDERSRTLPKHPTDQRKDHGTGSQSESQTAQPTLYDHERARDPRIRRLGVPSLRVRNRALTSDNAGGPYCLSTGKRCTTL
jgi:hypothetical protein